MEDEVAHGRIVETLRHETSAAQIDVADTRTEPMGVGQQAREARAQTDPHPGRRRAELLARGEHREEEPARQHTSHGGSAAVRRRPVRAGGVTSGELDVFVEPIRLQLHHAMPGDVVQESRDPPHVGPNVHAALGVRVIEHRAQHVA